jgi:type I restriction enzyme S subunit
LVEAAGKEKAAEAAEAKAMADFEAALGFAPPVPLPDRPIFVASFKDLDRWSHDAVLRRLIPEQPSGSKWREIRLSEVAEVVYGLQKHPGNRPGLNARPYLRVANVQRGKIDITEMKFIDVDDTIFRRLNLIKDDLLFVEGNVSRANLGRVAIWYGEIDGCIHQNHLIRARLDLARVTAQFAAAWFNSDAGRSHFFNEGKTTSGLGTINSTVIRDAPLPLPPISIQTALMEELNDAIAQANARRREAAVLRANAWRAFEASVYAADDTITATNIADAEAELVRAR